MRLLVVGLGAAGQRHARNLRTLLGRDVEIVAVRRRGGGVALSSGLQPLGNVLPETVLGMSTVGDLGEALQVPYDGVIVADPTRMHLESASAALHAGCSVLIEKPLSDSWKGVPDFLSAAAQSDARVLVGYQMRFHPLLERLTRLVVKGEFGAVVSASCTYGEYLPDWHPYEDYRKSYAARRDLGGGVLLTQIHDIDNLCSMLGWPERVFSLGGHLSGLDIDVEDTATTVWTSRAGYGVIPVRLHQDYTRRPPRRGIELVLEEGLAELDLLAARLSVRDIAGHLVLDERMEHLDRNALFVAEMRHFLACVRGEEQPLVPPDEAARSLAVALAALRSQTSGRMEDILYPVSPDESARARPAAQEETRHV